MYVRMYVCVYVCVFHFSIASPPCKSCPSHSHVFRILYTYLYTYFINTIIKIQRGKFICICSYQEIDENIKYDLIWGGGGGGGDDTE